MTSIYSMKHPFLAKIIEREVLNKHGSKKTTYRLSLDISGSSIQYKVGDSIGIFSKNDPEQIKAILTFLSLDPNTPVLCPRTNEKLILRELLSSKVNISQVNKRILQLIVDHEKNSEKKSQLEKLLLPENRALLKEYCSFHELWDLLKDHPNLSIPAQQFIDKLPPMLPRFYSIASSHFADHNKLEIVVSYFYYTRNGHQRHGVCSHYICHLASMHEPTIPIYLHPSKNFTLPEEKTKPIIMIGPGTGIAPFRGFMQERVSTKASKMNWLFFGSWNKAFDFYYESYWNELEAQGYLKVSTAFSRDQKEKIYVQNRMRENSKEFFDWIQKGAIIYVCGDAQHMAKDVEQTLVEIIQQEGKMSNENAKVYIQQMRKESRYQRDIY